MKCSHQPAESEASTCYDTDTCSVDSSLATRTEEERFSVVGWDSSEWHVQDFVVQPRGWSMRRGHMKKLLKPKMGKAAIWAEIQGQGKEVSRGRSVIKRSVNNGSFETYLDWQNIKAKAAKKHAWKVEMSCDLRDYEEGYSWEDDAVDYQEEYEDWEWAPIDSYVSSQPSQQTKTVAQVFRLPEVDRLAWRLKQVGAVLEKDGLENGNRDFIALQRHFLDQYGPSFCKELTRFARKTVHVRSAPVSTDVQERFLNARSTLQGALKLGYHGTNVANLASIYDRGLLIPGGRDNGIRVANGSVHGLGIYTATMDNPALSWGFCRAALEMEKKMMVCGVLDDASHSGVFRSYTLGTRTVSRESKNIRHVGSAMVIFDDRRVAPLFEVSLGREVDADVLQNNQNNRTVLFDWSRWANKLHQILSSAPVKERRPRKPLMRQQEKQQTVFAYLTRRGARKRNLKGL